MDKRDIDRIRNPGFTVARRGYDTREVDKFLRELSEWLETDAAEELGSFAVKHKLELAGKTTSQILLTTEAECEAMRQHAQSDAAKTVAEAKLSARETRRLAEEETTRQREETEREARDTVLDANSKAKHMLDDAEAKRAQIEADAAEKSKQAAGKARRMVKEGEERREAIEVLIADLRARRDSALEALNELSGDVGSVATSHRPAKGRDPFARPAELDPAERDSARPAERARA